MNILIVEDDENKRNQIVTHIAKILPFAHITTAQSLQSGLRSIIDNVFELIIVDMSMPTFDVGIDEEGGRTHTYAGREILRQMERRDIEMPVLVVTQFDRFGEGTDMLTLRELNTQLRQAHPHVYKGSIYYDVSMGTWKDELTKKIKSLND